MNKLFLGALFLIFGISQCFATTSHTEAHNLTISGVPINGTVIATSQTVTSDSVYQSGAPANGYSALVTQISGASASVKITYQTSYDNVNWFSPVTTNGTGTVTNIATLDSAAISNVWIVYPYNVYPYIRFNFASSVSGSSTVTAESLWQDWT